MKHFKATIFGKAARTASPLLLFVLAFLSLSASAQGIIHYFDSPPALNAEQQHYLSTISEDEVTREFKIVTVDADRIIGETLTFQIFNKTYIATLQKLNERGHRNYSWIGKTDDPLSGAIFVVNGDMVTGIFTFDFHRYVMYPLTGGLHVLAEIDQTAYPPDEAKDEYEKLVKTAGPPVLDKVGMDPGSEHEFNSRNPRVGDCTIRYLIAYTSNVNSSYADIHAHIQGSIDDHNLINDNSNGQHQVELARSVLVTYTQSGDITTDRDRFADPSDGFMDNIHGLRELYDADVCQLFTTTGGGCGLAKAIGANYASAFAVTIASCAIGNHTFAHETGHLYGMRHDPYVDNTNTPYAYGHGFVRATGSAATSWRTCMAYNDQCSDNGYNCTRLAYWSNPNITFGGVAMGTAATHNNARVAREQDITLANFEGQVTTKLVYASDVVANREQGHFMGNTSVTAPGNTSLTLTYNSGSIGTIRAASEITLVEGFTAAVGSEFTAELYSCTALTRQADEMAQDLPQEGFDLSLMEDGSVLAQVYPNPFSSGFTMKYFLSDNRQVTVVVFDMLGREVAQPLMNSAKKAGEHLLEIHAERWPDGLYQVVFMAGNQKQTFRLVKAN